MTILAGALCFILGFAGGLVGPWLSRRCRFPRMSNAELRLVAVYFGVQPKRWETNRQLRKRIRKQLTMAPGSEVP